jgi:hypothetical protein
MGVEMLRLRRIYLVTFRFFLWCVASGIGNFPVPTSIGMQVLLAANVAWMEPSTCVCSARSTKLGAFTPGEGYYSRNLNRNLCNCESRCQVPSVCHHSCSSELGRTSTDCNLTVFDCIRLCVWREIENLTNKSKIRESSSPPKCML